MHALICIPLSHARLLVCHDVTCDIVWRRKGSKYRGMYGRERKRKKRARAGLAGFTAL